MKIVGVIPARYSSVRFPGKILHPLAGKPLIQWVLEGASQAKSLATLLVATDDERIAAVVKGLGYQVVMTDPALPSGTDRIWAATRDLEADVLVNIQGDEPLITGALIDRLTAVFTRPPQGQMPDMATLAHPISESELSSPNAVKVVMNALGEALYFSRFPIPYSRNDANSLGTLAGCQKHIGLYAYSKSFLKRFCEAPPALIEKAESLEQLRALHLGAKIQVVSVEEGLRGVDTPEDALALESLMKSRRIHG
ncbi:MAG: 3-deoxy-manno-octulosonate cytidylyltransferase [Bdellovibrionaceae bacterium]|nr:3-deoxy-manno-octulosonate cytidylyltransferase [Pseudobdellovibrionaceae bacterium]